MGIAVLICHVDIAHLFSILIMDISVGYLFHIRFVSYDNDSRSWAYSKTLHSKTMRSGHGAVPLVVADVHSVRNFSIIIVIYQPKS